MEKVRDEPVIQAIDDIPKRSADDETEGKGSRFLLSRPVREE